LALVAVGGSLLEFLPQFVIGGMLLFVGFEFIYEWLWSSRRRMMTVDYLLMWVILLVIATGGFLPGVAVGLIAATGLFIYRYSKIDVVKHQLSGAEQQSNIERPVGETEFLVDSGESTLILELQGFIFFGTANKLLDRIRSSIDGRKRLEHLVFDFRRVTGVDSSAVAVFERIALLAREREIDLVFTAMANTHSGQFEDLVSAYHDVVVVHPDLDRGLAWCEERLLKGATARSPDARPESDHLPASIAAYLVGTSYEAGEILMNQGDPSPGILLIRSGRATVFLDGAEKRGIRLRTMLPGTVLGEISLYRDEPCTASVVADERCEVLHLTPDRFADLCRNDPVAAAELHSFVARTLAGRVSHANRVIRALHD
jgi:SulP family sulfate permease